MRDMTIKDTKSASRIIRAIVRIERIMRAYDRDQGWAHIPQYERAVSLRASLRDDLTRERRFQSEEDA